MSRILSRGRWVAAVIITVVAGGHAVAEDAAAPAKSAAAGEHRHDPIVVEARPIVSKFKVPFVRPRRVLQGRNGNLFVADWGAGTVVRIKPGGRTTIVAEHLNEPAGLAQDAAGNLYVSTHAAGMPKEGKIYKIGRNRMKEVYAEGLTGPTGLAFDLQDNLYVADFHENSIVCVTPGHEVSTFVGNIPAPSDVVIAANGDLYACSSTEGTIYRISAMGEVKVFARGLNSPSDLALDRNGRLFATCFGGGTVAYVSKNGRAQTFAIVPEGTIATLFDKRGNLVIANWNGHYLMKITTNLSIPCPHCPRKIPIRLQTPSKPRPPQSEPAPPVI